MSRTKSIAIISDIHGNFTALNKVLKEIEMYGDQISDIMCLGDLVGYNPEPEKCVNKIRKVCSKVIAGNHDKAMVGELNTDWFRHSVKKSISWTQKHLSDSSKSYLRSLNTREDIEIKGNKIILAHGSPNRDAPFTYIFNKYDVQNIEPLIMNTNILFIGHTHVPFCLYNEGEGWKNITKPNIEIDPEVIEETPEVSSTESETEEELVCKEIEDVKEKRPIKLSVHSVMDKVKTSKGRGKEFGKEVHKFAEKLVKDYKKETEKEIELEIKNQDQANIKEFISNLNEELITEKKLLVPYEIESRKVVLSGKIDLDRYPLQGCREGIR